MKFFDIVGADITIHPDALAIPAFESIWTSTKDKGLATRKIKYIVFNNHPDSPYVTSMPADVRSKRLLSEILPEFTEVSDDIKLAEEAYVGFMDTLTLQMLRGLRTNIEFMARALNKREDNDLSLRDMKELLDLAAKADKAIKSIYALEKQVRKDEIDNSTVRGGGQIGYFEVPRKK